MRWGIVGHGWVARDYMAPGIVAAGDEVTAIADLDEEVRTRAAREGKAVFASAEALVDSGRCDLIYVATPNRHHVRPVLVAARAGVPVLCEKPMAASVADAERIVAKVSHSGVLYGTAFDQRHHPAHIALRQQVREGRVGTPLAVRIVYACWVGPEWGEGPNWRADAGEAGGGAAMDLALHGLDLSEWFLGEPLVTLQAETQRKVHDYSVEDGAMLIGKTEGGVLVSLHVAYNCREALPRRRLEVIGSEGCLEAVDTMGQTAGGTLLRRCGHGGPDEMIDFDRQGSPFAAQAAAFSAAARGAPHEWSAANDLRLMRLFDTAYRKALACH